MIKSWEVSKVGGLKLLCEYITNNFRISPYNVRLRWPNSGKPIILPAVCCVTCFGGGPKYSAFP